MIHGRDLFCFEKSSKLSFKFLRLFFENKNKRIKVKQIKVKKMFKQKLCLSCLKMYKWSLSVWKISRKLIQINNYNEPLFKPLWFDKIISFGLFLYRFVSLNKKGVVLQFKIFYNLKVQVNVQSYSQSVWAFKYC